MHIVGLRMTNWSRFRGTVELDLGPGAYAIVAEWDGDAERSNWAGKSSLVRAIFFALTGHHPWRLEDDWITEDEPDGGVDLELSDGTFITRTRVRGSSTKLRVVAPQPDGSEREAHGDEAQALIVERLGFDRVDSAATWWVEQGSMARLVSGDSSELTQAMVSWLGLEKLADAHAHNNKRWKEIAREHARLSTRAEDLKIRIEAQGVDDLAECEAEVARLEVAVDELGGAAAIGRWNDRRRDEEAHARWKRLKENRAEQLKVEPRKVSADSQAAQRVAVQGLAEKRAIASKELDGKRALARGEFDGRCPVGGVACPIKDKLNADSAQNRKLAREADAAFKLATASHEEGLRELRKCDAMEREHDAWRQALAAIDRRIEEEAPAARRFVDGIEPPDPADVQSAIAALESARSKAKAHSAAVEQAVRMREELAPMEAEILRLSKEIVARREAAAILGRNGAPRVLAERALAELEAGANAALARCGIDLSMEVRWAREGKKLSSTCYTCGAALPASQKVKACPECGAERGPQLDERLHVACSASSGGALDLVGSVLQLSAARWLRARRGSDWAVAVLDEPLGQIDRHNRRALAGKLAGALGEELGLEQAFLISHDPATLDAMPGRIVVRATVRGSTAVVE